MGSKDDFTMSGDGYRVTRNGVTLHKPEWMSDNHWFKYEAPRVGKDYVKGSKVLFGHDEEAPLEGVEEMEEGCSGGACAI
tara:strand:+ start:315 stop:554 length:240 start_codon:yes stop_codon:yes gene_type:complete